MVRQRIQAFSRLGHLASAPRRPFSHFPQSTIRSQSLYASRPRYIPRSIPQTQSRSYTAFEQFKNDLRGASRDNPFMFAVGASLAIGSILTFFYVMYDHATAERPHYEKFPPELSKYLRRAVYLGEIEQRPMLAFDHYKQALVAAEQLGMHPFSDDVLGIKISVSEMFEKTGYIKPAIEILERTMRDCRTWVENGRRRQSINDLEKQRGGKHGAVAVDADAEAPQLGFDEEKQRDKVMKRTVGMAAHVSYLYSSNFVKNPEKALDAAIEASNWSHTEIQRRGDLGLPVSTASGDDFLNLTDAAIVHASLAELYSERENHDLAASLYRHAAELLREDEEGRPNSCLQATYVGSVGAEMTNQWSKEHLTAKAGKQPTADLQSGPSALDASKQWLTKSLEMASHIKPPVRDELCEQCSGTALYNLGAMAVMCNDYTAAKTHFEKAKSFFQKMGDLQQVDSINKELDDLRSKMGRK